MSAKKEPESKPVSVKGSKPGLASSPVSDDASAAAAAAAAAAECDVCYWNGKAYSRGARICNQDATPNELLECRNMNGTMMWIRRGIC